MLFWDEHDRFLYKKGLGVASLVRQPLIPRSQIDDTLPYHVIHRIASVPNVHGVFKSIMDFCFSKERNIRIDTHRDNLIMQHNILKHGFTYCGIIYLASGDERLAYQKK